MSEGFEVAEAYVALKVDDTGLRERITAAVEAAAEGQGINVKLGVDGAVLREKIDAEIGAASGEKVTIGLAVDGGGVRDKVQAEAEAAKTTVRIRVDTDTAGAAEKLAVIEAAARHADEAGNGLTQDAQGKWRNALGQFATDAEKAAAGVDDLGKKSSGAGDKANSSGSGFLGLSGKIWALVGAALAAGPALAALPAAIGAAGLAAGTLGLAFSGVAKALQDHAAASAAAGQSGASLAATTFSNAVAIKGAEQAIADARRQSAISAQTSADAIVNAQQGVADAVRTAATAAISSAQAVQNAQQGVADAVRTAATAAQSSANQIASAQQGITNALYAQGQAEQSYTNALYSEKQAQQALTQARQDAANTIADLSNSAVDSHLAVQQATFGVTDAQTALTLAQNNGMATPEQLAKAQLALAQAQQGLVDAKQRDLEATQKATAATKQGVEQLPAVVSAEHAVTQAVEATAAARHGVEQAALAEQAATKALADAQTAAANQQIASDEAVAKARQSLADAQRAEAQQQITSAEQVAKAQQGLANAQRSADQQKAASLEAVQKAVQALSDMEEQQRLAAAAASASSSTASNQFQKDMAAMSPAARALTDQILSMKAGFDLLKTTAQTSVLPGFTTMLQDMSPLLPIVNTAVADMGATLGRTAVSFGDLFKNPQFQASLSQFLLQVNAGFAQFASGLAPMFSSMISISVQAAPILNALSVGIHNLMVSGLPQFFAGLTVNASGAGQAVGGMLGIVNGLLGPVGQLAGMISGAAGPALAGLVAPVSLLARSIDSGLMPVMPQLQAALLAVVNVIDQLVPILQPAIAMFGTGLADALKIVTPLLDHLASFLHDNASWLQTVAEGIMLWAVATKALSIEQGIAKFVTTQWSGAMKLFAEDSKAAGLATKLFGEGTSGALMGIGKSIPVIGAVAIGAAALGSWLGSLGKHADGTALSLAAMTSRLLDLAGATDQTSAAFFKQQASVIAMADHMNKGSDAAKGLDGAFANLVQNGHATDAADQVKKLTDEYVKQGGNVEHLTKDLPQYQAALDQQSLSQQLAASKTKDANTALGGNADATKAAADAASSATTPSGPFAGLALRLGNVDQAGGKAVTQLQNLDTQLSKIDAARNQQTALDAVTKSMNDLKTGAAGADGAIKGHSTSLQGNTDAALANRAQLSGSVAALRDFYDKQIAAGVSVDTANGKFNDQVAALEQQAVKTYGSKQAVDDFLKSVGLVPPTTTTTVSVDTHNGVETIKTIQTQIDSLHGRSVDVTIDRIYGPNNEVITLHGTRITANALGGPVQAGETSLVGEKGPEIVTFGRAGTVIPNDQIMRAAAMSPHTSSPSQASQTAGAGTQFVQNFYGPQHPTPEQRNQMMREFNLAVAR